MAMANVVHWQPTSGLLAQVNWLGPPTLLFLHSLREPGELSQYFQQDKSTTKIIVMIIININNSSSDTGWMTFVYKDVFPTFFFLHQTNTVYCSVNFSVWLLKYLLSVKMNLTSLAEYFFTDSSRAFARDDFEFYYLHGSVVTHLRCGVQFHT